MYQTSIRNKKKLSQFNKVSNNNYNINKEYEEFAYVIKLLGNCRVLVLCDNGNEAIGVIRGSMRRFNKRVLIETGDILAVSMREYQDNKVDIVHKYNAEQCKILINNKEISDTLINAYNKISNAAINNTNEANIIFDDAAVAADAGDADASRGDSYANSKFEFDSDDYDDEEADDETVAAAAAADDI